MEYLTGHTLKPYEVTTLGEVLFTDGTNTGLMTNQQTCEAYGYTYDRATGTCRSFRYNSALESNIGNMDNKNNGPGNTNALGSNTIQVNGTQNTTRGRNNNCFINGSNNEIANAVNNSTILGSNNEIANGVDNATVLGSNGVARIDCEFVTSSSDGVGQYSIFFLSGRTSNAADTFLELNGETGVTVIPRLADTLYRYTIDLISYRTGGSSGSGAAGDRGFFRIEGMVVGPNANETYTTIASKGYITGITFVTAYDVADMVVQVNGIADQDLVWGGTAKFYQMKI